MDINYELYKVFYFVATSLSFSDASKQLYISQSAVSQSIKTLEKKLEQPLFIRSTKKVQLTPAGKLLLKHIEPAMNLIQRGENQLLETLDMSSGLIEVLYHDVVAKTNITIDDWLNEVKKVTKEEIMEVANKVQLDTVYFLSGREVSSS